MTVSYTHLQKNLEMTYIKDREVLYSDVDINIQYRKEIRPREMVKLFMGEDDHRYLIEGRNEQDDVYFTIEIYFFDR